MPVIEELKVDGYASSSVLSLPSPLQQTHYAEASGKDRNARGNWCRSYIADSFSADDSADHGTHIAFIRTVRKNKLINSIAG